MTKSVVFESRHPIADQKPKTISDIPELKIGPPADRSTNEARTENLRPAGGEQIPTNLVRVSEKPAPTADQFGGYKG